MVESDRLLVLILVILSVAAVWIGLSYIQGDTYINLLTGGEESVALTLSWQIELGKELEPDFEEQLGGLVNDPQAQRRVSRIGLRLVHALAQMENAKQAQVRRRLNWSAFPLQFKVLNSDQINAFALPNGSIYITQGLLQHLESDDQVAAVLGHEMGHVVLRHAAKDLAARIKGNVVIFAFQTIFGKELAQLVGGAAYLLELSYSREQEREADHVGYLLSCFGGYNPQAMLEVFKFLKAQEGVIELEFLRTHPLSQTRINYLSRLSCALPRW